MFKGFNKDMTCRGFQYEAGKSYEEPTAELCSKGFHACEYPLDCFAYYAPAQSVYREVELDDISDQREGDTKFVAKKIKIGAKIDIAGMIRAAIEYTIERTHEVSGGTSTGDQGAASNTGDQGAASNTGYRGAASNTGYRGAASSEGLNSVAVTIGRDSSACVSNNSSIACALGKDSFAKGSIGSWLILTERGEWNDCCYPIISVVSVKVDGEKIKPDTWYKLLNGEVIVYE